MGVLSSNRSSEIEFLNFVRGYEVEIENKDMGKIKDCPIIHLLKVSLQLVESIHGLSSAERGAGGFGFTEK